MQFFALGECSDYFVSKDKLDSAAETYILAQKWGRNFIGSQAHPRKKCLQLSQGGILEREQPPLVLDAWYLWSQAMTKMIFTEEDQYGPLRVGHSYPLLFWKEPFVPKPNIPSSKHAMLGDKIVYANYYPHEHILQAPGALRNAAEMKSLQIFMELWSSGTEPLGKAIANFSKVKKLGNGCCLWASSSSIQ
jgi:hypothetical protein